MKYYTLKNCKEILIDSDKSNSGLSLGHIWMVSLKYNQLGIYTKEEIIELTVENMDEQQKSFLVSARLKGII